MRAVKLLLEAGAVVDIKDDEGTTALGEAALGGINDTLAMLLQAGADPNSANFVDGRTPLIGAGSRLLDSKQAQNPQQRIVCTSQLFAIHRIHVRCATVQLALEQS